MGQDPQDRIVAVDVREFSSRDYHATRSAQTLFSNACQHSYRPIDARIVLGDMAEGKTSDAAVRALNSSRKKDSARSKTSRDVFERSVFCLMGFGAKVAKRGVRPAETGSSEAEKELIKLTNCVEGRNARLISICLWCGWRCRRVFASCW